MRVINSLRTWSYNASTISSLSDTLPTNLASYVANAFKLSSSISNVSSDMRGISMSGLTNGLSAVASVISAIFVARSLILSRSVIIFIQVPITLRSPAIGCCSAISFMHLFSISNSILSTRGSYSSMTLAANSLSCLARDWTES